MGVDFLKSKCKPFAKGWDKTRLNSARNRLAAAAEGAESSLIAKDLGWHSFRQGDEVLLCAVGEKLCLLADMSPAAELVRPSAELLEAIRDAGGYANGTIAASYPTLELLRVDIRR